MLLKDCKFNCFPISDLPENPVLQHYSHTKRQLSKSGVGTFIILLSNKIPQNPKPLEVKIPSIESAWGFPPLMIFVAFKPRIRIGIRNRLVLDSFNLIHMQGLEYLGIRLYLIYVSIHAIGTSN